MTSLTRRSLTLTGAMKEHARNKSAPGLILPKVKDHMLKAYGWDAGRDPTVVHPSELAKSDLCLRAVYRRIISGHWPPEKESFDFVRENIFATGNDIHAKWQGRIRAAGFPVWGDWKCIHCRSVERACLEPSSEWDSYVDCAHSWRYDEVTLNAKSELLIAGHADAGFDDTLVEIKGLALDTPLPTPTGWTTMGEVQQGDYLMASDGTPTKVTRKSAPRKIGTYIVRFEDGSTVVCDKEHLWKVTSGPADYKKEQVLGIEDIRSSLKHSGKQFQHRVLNAKPFSLPDSDLPVGPYTLGAWIGDGTCSDQAKITNMDEEVFQGIAEEGYVLGRRKHRVDNGKASHCSIRGLITELKVVGLAGVHSPERFIPPEYLRSSHAQRVRLLQGLMDTDGTWMAGRNQACFTTTSKQLADDVFELVASLGQRPYLLSNIARGFGVETTAYHVRWTTLGIMPFTILRKQEKVRMSPYQEKRSSQRLIRSVEPGPDVWTACVAVDSYDNTYLCGRAMIPTHNSIGLGSIRMDAPDLLARYQDGKMTDLTGLWKGLNKPLVSHLRQGDVYLHLAHVLGLPFTRIVYLYEFKANQLTKEFTISYDAGRSMKLVAKAEEVKYAIQSGIAPKCIRGHGCKQCDVFPRRRTVAGTRADLS